MSEAARSAQPPADLRVPTTTSTISTRSMSTTLDDDLDDDQYYADAFADVW